MERESNKKTSRDWTIPLFDEIVSSADETLLRSLWRVVVAAPADRADAHYRPNAARKLNVMRSQLLQKLTTVPWVLDRHGNLNIPENMTAADLDEHLQVPADSPLLTRAGFGRLAAAAQSRRVEADRAAQEFGFDTSDDLSRIGLLRKKNPERFKELLELLEAAEIELPRTLRRHQTGEPNALQTLPQTPPTVDMKSASDRCTSKSLDT